MKTVHPSKFFENVKFIDKYIRIVAASDDVVNKLKGVHPRNFISTDIQFGIIEFDVSYDTKNGNRKTSTKYVIQKYEPEEVDDPDYIAEIQVESDVNKYNLIHPEAELKNFKIENAKLLCLATLPIG